MAAFVSISTCHYGSVTSTRRGLIYRDSLSVLSRNLRPPRGPPGPPGLPGPPRPLQGRLARLHLPESSAASKPPSIMKHLFLSHLRRLLTLSPAHQRRGLQRLG